MNASLGVPGTETSRSGPFRQPIVSAGHWVGTQDLAAGPDDQKFHGDLALGPSCGLFGKASQTAATRYLHDHDSKRPDLGVIDHRHQFFEVDLLVAVQFWTRDRQRSSREMAVVKISDCECHAIGRKQHIGVAEERGGRRHQMQLHGPMTELG